MQQGALLWNVRRLLAEVGLVSAGEVMHMADHLSAELAAEAGQVRGVVLVE